MTLLALIFLIGIGVPTVVALGVSLRETSLRTIRIVRRAPRSRSSATIVIYHTDDRATAATLRSLRRLRVVKLNIIIVVPTDTTLTQPVPTGVLVHRKQRPASRELTIASCYNLVNPSLPLCVIESGDTMTAHALHTALATFRRTPLQWVLYRRHAPLETTFISIMQWYAEALQHVRNVLRKHMPHRLPSGLWLRSGSLLRTSTTAYGCYIPAVQTRSVVGMQPAQLNPPGVAASITLLAGALPCYVAAMQLQAALPLITFWIICTWWLNVLISLTPGRTSEKLLPAVCAPLGGILLPAWCTLLIGLTLQRAGRRLAGTRRQHTEHHIFFRLRHP